MAGPYETAKSVHEMPKKCGICNKRKLELPNGFRVCEECDLKPAPPPGR